MSPAAHKSSAVPDSLTLPGETTTNESWLDLDNNQEGRKMTPTLAYGARPVTVARRFVLILAVVIAGVLPCAAQTTLGTIRGTIYDPQQGIVPGVTVVVTDESTNVAREAQSDSDGLFEIPNLRPG